LNPAYVPQYTGNQIYARMALKRCLLSDVDRRGVMLVNRRAINASPYLKAIALGLSEEEVREKTAESKRRKTADAPTTPQTAEETLAYIWQHAARAATMDAGRQAPVLKPHEYMIHVMGGRVVKKKVPRVALLREPLNALSARHKIITHYGTSKVNDAEDVEWTALAPGAEIPMVHRRGQRGGHLSLPLVQFSLPDSVEFQQFQLAVQAVFKLP